ncbi:MAG TPA: small acid-soluble spore protein Tlp [Syntrophomonadaceae bacterium]|nr:small acid-soluble spore protein Tlp [Syntrophomonadaceae bacterium]
MKHKPDDRRDNVDKIQQNIDNTIENMEIAEEMIALSDNDKTKQDLQRKNEKRDEALDDMRKEIRDEAVDKKHGYK